MNSESSFIIAMAAATIVIGLLAVFVIYFVIVYRKKQRVLEYEREEFKRTLLEAQIEIKEQTLSDISRELHDNFGQIASIIKMNLNLVLADMPPTKSVKISDSLKLLKELIADMRSLSASLKGENLARFGLVNMIKEDLIRYRNVGALEINFETSDTIPSMNNSYEIFIYRMSQEIFNNILKHSKADKVEVKLTYLNSIFEFSVSDNGVGFDSESETSGAGILNIKQRCEMIGASLKIESIPSQGTRVIIKMKDK